MKNLRKLFTLIGALAMTMVWAAKAPQESVKTETQLIKSFRFASAEWKLEEEVTYVDGQREEATFVASALNPETKKWQRTVYDQSLWYFFNADEYKFNPKNKNVKRPTFDERRQMYFAQLDHLYPGVQQKKLKAFLAKKNEARTFTAEEKWIYENYFSKNRY